MQVQQIGFKNYIASFLCTQSSLISLKGGPVSIQVKNQTRVFSLFWFLINTRLFFTSRNDSKMTLEYIFSNFLETFKFFLSKIDKVIEMQKRFSRDWKIIEPALWCVRKLRYIPNNEIERFFSSELLHFDLFRKVLKFQSKMSKISRFPNFRGS